MNFVAWNVDFPSCLHVCFAIAQANNVPLRQEEIKEIVDFQAYERATRELTSQERSAALLSDAAIRDVDEFLHDGSKKKEGMRSASGLRPIVSETEDGSVRRRGGPR